MNNRAKVSTIIGIVVVIATVLIFAIVHPAIFPSAILGFAFILYSEIIFFAGFAFVEYWASKSSQIMTRAGIGVPIGIYAIAVFVSSIIYINLHIIFYRGFLVLQILMLVAAVTITLVMTLASNNRAVKDSKVLQADAMVRGFAEELTLIRSKTDKKASIDKVIDAIKYSDTSVMVDVDVELNDAIKELKDIVSDAEFDEPQFYKTVEAIELLVKKRNIQTRNLKQGGI